MGCDIIFDLIEDDERKEIRKEDDFPIPMNTWNKYEALNSNPYKSQNTYDSQETMNNIEIPMTYQKENNMTIGQSIMMKRHGGKIFNKQLENSHGYLYGNSYNIPYGNMYDNTCSRMYSNMYNNASRRSYSASNPSLASKFKKNVSVGPLNIQKVPNIYNNIYNNVNNVGKSSFVISKNEERPYKSNNYSKNYGKSYRADDISRATKSSNNSKTTNSSKIRENNNPNYNNNSYNINNYNSNNIKPSIIYPPSNYKSFNSVPSTGSTTYQKSRHAFAPMSVMSNSNNINSNYNYMDGSKIEQSSVNMPVEQRVNKALKNVPVSPEEEELGKNMLESKVGLVNSVIDQQHNLDKTTYEGRMLEAINIARTNPARYAKLIEKSMKYIEEEQIKRFDERTGREIIQNQIVFKKKVKVALNRGKKAFIEAANILKSLPPMNPLRIRRKIMIPPPETTEELHDPRYGEKMAVKIRERHNINVFFRENIRNPEVAVLLMIVDDSRNPGKKRNALLNPLFTKMAVGEKFFGNEFIAYITFSK